ncbi:MAG: right-handed parallel beta-helix repeat-containing protein, partial [Planctomycetia bacterium]|nr:right-handed parallel beta-helix repeat-containing protein [Planctomycetia bacterium]
VGLVNTLGPGATGNLIQNNYIGTDRSGTAALGGGTGVNIYAVGGNTVGGLAAGDRNVISGGTLSGVVVQAGGSGNLIEGNFIGTDATGAAALGNAAQGVYLLDSPSNTVGGTSAAAGNVISGNLGNGVRVGGAAATGNLIEGNLIGTNAGGAAIANALDGVLLQLGASNNTVGGLAAGAGNTIANNTGVGVRVDAGTGDSVLSDSIFNNAGGGIILANAGNHNQAAPVVTTAPAPGGGTEIDGTLAAAAGTTYLIQYFDNNPPSGQGRTLIGSQTVSSTGGGPLSFTFNGPAVPAGSTVTATATVTASPSNPSNGDTSAFSVAAALVNPFIVTNTRDSGIGSLRFALQAGDADVANDDTILFRIPTSDPNYDPATGSWTIHVQSGLSVTKPASGGTQHSVLIDALTQQTQPGAATNHPVIAVTPAGGYAGDGLTLNSGGNTVRGLAVGGFQGTGIVVAAAGRNVFTGNDVGTDPTGTKAVPNLAAGFRVFGTGGNTIGGPTPAERNVVSGNGSGIAVFGPSSGNVVEGNYVGTDSTGSRAVGNLGFGVGVGGTGPKVLGNVVAANGRYGIWVVSGADGAVVQGNKVGTDAQGTNALGNASLGVLVQGANTLLG